MKNGGENNYHRTTTICSSPARSCSRSPADDTTTTIQSQTSSSGTLPTTRHIESASRLSFGIREILGAERINPSELLIPITCKDSNSDRSAKPWPSPIVYLSGRPPHPTRPTELGFGYAGATYLPGLSNVQRHFARCAESVAQGHRVGLRPDYLCPEFRGLVERLYSSSQSDAEREHLIGQDLQRDMSMSQRHLGPAGMNLASAVMSSASSAFAWMSERKDRMQVTRRIGHPYQTRNPPRCKKPRTSFSRHQIVELEKRFHRQKYLASAERTSLAKGLKMTDAQVKTWFQNRRTKWRRQTSEEREAERQTANRLLLSLTNDTTGRPSLYPSPVDPLCMSNASLNALHHLQPWARDEFSQASNSSSGPPSAASYAQGYGLRTA